MNMPETPFPTLRTGQEPDRRPEPSEQLLREFVQHHSESAFAELVKRHIPVVYGAAIRRCRGDADMAADVTQTVFVDLAKKAATLPNGVVLAGWLHRHATFVASTAVRAEVRRRQRETVAMERDALTGENASDLEWIRVSPVLEEALQELPERDRDAIVLRYLDGQAFERVGAALGVSADAARMRVDRAVDKLRSLLIRRGITSTVAALSMALGQHGVVAVPVGLASSIATAVAVASGATASTLTLSGLAGACGTPALSATTASNGTIGILSMITTTKIALGLAGIVAVGATGIAGKTRLERNELETRLNALSADLAAARTESDAVKAALAQDEARLEEAKQERLQLLALRGEVGSLREAARELARLKESNAARSQQPAAIDPNKELSQAEMEELTRKAEDEMNRAFGILRMTFAKHWALAFYQYAEEHDGMVPTTFAEAEKHFPEEHRSAMSVFDPNRFEIVYKGRLKDIQNPARTLLLREKAPFENPSRESRQNGRPLAKTYAFADGHSEIFSSTEDGFATWEKDRMVTASTER